MHSSRVFQLPVGIGFRGEFLDFDRGIRVGNLEPHERITRILKLALETRYRQGFLTERWGRGVYWQWIAFLARANREAKPISKHVSFGCAKFFIMVDTEEKLFKSGVQVERGYLEAPPEYRACELRSDWDWNRLLKALRAKRVSRLQRDKLRTSSGLRGTTGETPVPPIERELRRLLREGFLIHAGSWEEKAQPISKTNYPGVRALRERFRQAAPREWAGFQVFYPMDEQEVQGATGVELVEAMLAVFEETRGVMNACTQVRLA